MEEEEGGGDIRRLQPQEKKIGMGRVFDSRRGWIADLNFFLESLCTDVVSFTWFIRYNSSATLEGDPLFRAGAWVRGKQPWIMGNTGVASAWVLSARASASINPFCSCFVNVRDGGNDPWRSSWYHITCVMRASERWNGVHSTFEQAYDIKADVARH